MPHCTVCNVNCPNPFQFHSSGRKHQMAESLLRRAASTHISSAGNDYPNGWCILCNVPVPQGTTRVMHEAGRPHLRQRQVLQRFRSQQRSAAPPAPTATNTSHQGGGTPNAQNAPQTHNGVQVSHGAGVDFGFVEYSSQAAQGERNLDLLLRTTTSNLRIKISTIRVTALAGGSTSFTANIAATEDQLKTTRDSRVHVRFNPHNQRGRHEARIEITLLNVDQRTTFVISRIARAEVGSRADHDLLGPSTPYKRPRRKAKASSGDIIPGVPVPSHQIIEYIRKLKKYPIPIPLHDAVNAGTLEEKVAQVKAIMPTAFTPSTYPGYWSTLLWAEEVQQKIDLQIYDMHNVQLVEHRGNQYLLNVPGLAEKRPSVIVGDRLLVRPVDSNGNWFEGHVHEVQQITVSLRFHRKFTWIRGTRYDVEFQLNRVPLQRMHQAVASPFAEERVLFPTLEHVSRIQVPTDAQINNITTINRDIRGNAAQLLAVASVMHLPPGSPPFVIFGPPGTGKTVTVVESILQVLKTDPNSRILACAPSNSAADLIVSRLRNLDPLEMYRLNAKMRPVYDVNSKPEVKRFCQPMDERWFKLPPVATLEGYRIIVTTCISASVLHGVGVKRGHFTHMFLDEAGHATEPEIMTAIKTLVDAKTNIILSGDPKQLSPIVRSATARNLGLTLSYLERLMNSDAYHENERRGISVVKLVKNYRSDPAILRFPNEQFYSGDLEPHGDVVITSSHHTSPILATPGFPVVFEGVVGKDEREASSPSYFNKAEASVCRAYTQELLTDNHRRIAPEDIGIITPYHAQAQKIRRLIQPFAPKVKVGSVEEFQGQERRVIIISTVRSSTEFLSFDLRHTLGFVANPKRLNVALTRARSLLIVIGNPQVLSLDPTWRRFLNYVHISGGWKGQAIDWNPHDPVQEDGYDSERRGRAEEDRQNLAQGAEAMELDGEEEANVDLTWRGHDEGEGGGMDA